MVSEDRFYHRSRTLACVSYALCLESAASGHACQPLPLLSPCPFSHPHTASASPISPIIATFRRDPNRDGSISKMEWRFNVRKVIAPATCEVSGGEEVPRPCPSVGKAWRPCQSQCMLCAVATATVLVAPVLAAPCALCPLCWLLLCWLPVVLFAPCAGCSCAGCPLCWLPLVLAARVLAGSPAAHRTALHPTHRASASAHVLHLPFLYQSKECDSLFDSLFESKEVDLAQLKVGLKKVRREAEAESALLGPWP